MNTYTSWHFLKIPLDHYRMTKYTDKTKSLRGQPPRKLNFVMQPYLNPNRWNIKWGKPRPMSEDLHWRLRIFLLTNGQLFNNNPVVLAYNSFGSWWYIDTVHGVNSSLKGFVEAHANRLKTYSFAIYLNVIRFFLLVNVCFKQFAYLLTNARECK